jgi:hypothetical protein
VNADNADALSKFGTRAPLPRAVLPADTLLDVPYADLVADQESWTRKIVAFLGLEWDDRCMEFHKTERPVATSSFWQVRQRIYKARSFAGATTSPSYALLWDSRRSLIAESSSHSPARCHS